MSFVQIGKKTFPNRGRRQPTYHYVRQRQAPLASICVKQNYICTTCTCTQPPHPLRPQQLLLKISVYMYATKIKQINWGICFLQATVVVCVHCISLSLVSSVFKVVIKTRKWVQFPHQVLLAFSLLLSPPCTCSCSTCIQQIRKVLKNRSDTL